MKKRVRGTGKREGGEEKGVGGKGQKGNEKSDLKR